MLKNNGQRLLVWMQLSNPFDYLAMNQLCTRNDVDQFTAFDFAKKVGMLLTAKHLYADLEITAAYQKFLDEYANQQVAASSATIAAISKTTSSPPVIADCPSCGGGRVL